MPSLPAPAKRARLSSPANSIPSKGTSKGKGGKQKSRLDTPKWAAQDSAGAEICRNHDFGAADVCRRSHTCPIIKDDGSGQRGLAGEAPPPSHEPVASGATA
eukprot:5332558-Amphidinium_carterae.1